MLWVTARVMEFRVLRWETLYIDTQIWWFACIAETRDLQILSYAAAALTASTTAQNSKRILRAYAQWTTRLYLLWIDPFFLRNLMFFLKTLVSKQVSKWSFCQKQQVYKNGPQFVVHVYLLVNKVAQVDKCGS